MKNILRKGLTTLTYRYLCVSLLFCCGFPHVIRAQSPEPENVIVDGNLSEWGGSLRNYDKTAQLYYQVHNDHDFLYIALKRPRYAWKMALSGRVSFELSAGEADKREIKIVYPGHYSDNKEEMWNYLEVRAVGRNSTDTVTIYNDYGIQAFGRFWDKQEVAAGRDLSSEGSGTVKVVGADCELAIPMKLLPVTAGTCIIRIVMTGEQELLGALGTLGNLAGFDLLNATADAVEDLRTDSKLTITYHLK